MKSLIASIIIMSLVIIITVCGSILLCSNLTSLLEEVEKIEPQNEFESIKQQVDITEKKLKNASPLYSLITNDTSSEKLELYLCDIKASAESKDAEGVRIAKSRLIAHIEQMRRLCTLNLDSIF